MVGVWEGLNLGSIQKKFLCFGMHPKIIDVHHKLIPKGGVVLKIGDWGLPRYGQNPG